MLGFKDGIDAMDICVFVAGIMVIAGTLGMCLGTVSSITFEIIIGAATAFALLGVKLNKDAVTAQCEACKYKKYATEHGYVEEQA